MICLFFPVFPRWSRVGLGWFAASGTCVHLLTPAAHSSPQSPAQLKRLAHSSTIKRFTGDIQSSDFYSFAVCAKLFWTRILQQYESVFILRWQVLSNCYHSFKSPSCESEQCCHVCHTHSHLGLLAPLIQSQTSSQFLRPSADHTGGLSGALRVYFTLILWTKEKGTSTRAIIL